MKLTKTATNLLARIRAERCIPQSLLTGRDVFAATELSARGYIRFNEFGGERVIVIHTYTIGG